MSIDLCVGGACGGLGGVSFFPGYRSWHTLLAFLVVVVVVQ